jgi:hypothetical protein
VKLVVIIYVILSIVFFVDIILSINVLDAVRQAVNVRERPKLVSKIKELKSMKKYALVWPYIIFKLVRDNDS